MVLIIIVILISPRFMVPMHAKNRKEALHEPRGRAGGPPPAVG
jgi:hypothetical protein